MANIGTLFYIMWLLGISLTSDASVLTSPNIRCNDAESISDTIVSPQFSEESVKDFPESVRRIVIDAGHGGHDHGCSGAHSKEKDITLGIALKLGEAIKAQFSDIEVLYTRTTDVFVPLHKRIDLANKEDADIFISIHANAFNDISVNGTEVFVMGLHTAEENLEVAKRENAAVLLEADFESNYDGFDPGSPEAQIILSMYQNAYLEKSISLARKITDQIAFDTGFNNRGVKQAGFVILRKASMPSVLIESGFLSNSSDEEFLHKPEGQEMVANAIASAIGEYRKEVSRENRHMAAIKVKTQEALRQTGHTEMVFRVQLAAYSEQSNPGMPDFVAGEAIDIISEGKLKKIIAGKFPDYKSANAFKTKIVEDGTFANAFIVVYKGNERIPLQEALKSKQNRP